MIRLAAFLIALLPVVSFAADDATFAGNGHPAKTAPAFVTNTYYISSVTRTSTGNGTWIDTRGATKVIFSVSYAPTSDHAAVIGAGVTSYIDGSNELSSNLAEDSVWTGPAILSLSGANATKAPDIYTISDPPNALRWRITGVFGSTVSVRYKIIR